MSTILTQRWEEGKEHHPVALAFASLIVDAERHCRHDLELNFGGDGDNGEDMLMALSQLLEDNPEALRELRNLLDLP